MISRLSITNFQSHKHTELEFSNGVCAITGPSDVGKSAILRALNWVINNEPSGAAFRSYWAGKEPTKVTILLDSGDSITRARTKSQNYYELNGERFNSFGKGVPDEIKGLLNIQSVNTQTQLSSPFLLIGSSPGEVGRYFNNIAKLDVIDKAISNGNRFISRHKNSIVDAEARLAGLASSLDELGWVDEADGYLSQLEKTDGKIIAVGREELDLSAKVMRIKSLQEKMAPLALITATAQEVKKLVVLKVGLNRLRTDVGTLTALIDDAILVKRHLDKHAKLAGAKKDVKGLIEKNALLVSLIEQEDKLDGVIDKIFDTTSRLHDTREDIEQYKSELPDMCPTCGQRVESWDALKDR